jgi:hypothetical protein
VGDGGGGDDAVGRVAVEVEVGGALGDFDRDGQRADAARCARRWPTAWPPPD